jgi:hypothetical protein
MRRFKSYILCGIQLQESTADMLTKKITHPVKYSLRYTWLMLFDSTLFHGAKHTKAAAIFDSKLALWNS